MQLSTFLMFTGAAQQAMQLYVSLFPGSRVVSLQLYGPGETGGEGSVKQAVFELNGVRYMCIDSPVHHAFSFTPSISLFVDCDSREQFEHVLAALNTEGKTFMPPDSYGFSKRFAWIQDVFGVSWQLNLP